jgi:hypothetical protein
MTTQTKLLHYRPDRLIEKHRAGAYISGMDQFAEHLRDREKRYQKTSFHAAAKPNVRIRIILSGSAFVSMRLAGYHRISFL